MAERFIRGCFHLLLLILLALGTPFVLHYHFDNAWIGPYSSRFVVGVLLPYVAGCAAAIWLALLPHGARGRLLAPLGRFPGPAAAALALACCTGSVAYALFISDEYISILLLIVLPCLIASMGAASRRTANPLLVGLPFLVAGIGLFAVELSDQLTGPPFVIWGDERAFATKFPRQPPFIGPGGRLRPRLNARMKAPEYRAGARITTSSVGFRNSEEFDPRPGAGECRILSLGDSFSVGYRADQDAFFGSILERLLDGSGGGAHARRVRVMNAEVSDPAYGLQYLQSHGTGYHPALVIYGLSGNDVMQAEQFFGADRLFTFDAAGRLVPNAAFDPSVANAWDRFSEFAYPVEGDSGAEPRALLPFLLPKLVRFRVFSGLTEAAARAGTRPVPIPAYAELYERADGRKRLIDGTANLGFFYVKGGEAVERMYEAFTQVLIAMDRTARASGSAFLLVLHPQRYQAQTQDWEIMKQRWRLLESDFDLRLYNRRLASLCVQRGIACCDPLDDFIEAARGESLYLPEGDTHYNRNGHRVAAEAAARCVEKMGLPRERAGRRVQIYSHADRSRPMRLASRSMSLR